MKNPTTKSANLWHNRSFNIYWAGQAFSSLGDAFALIAVPLLVLPLIVLPVSSC